MGLSWLAENRECGRLAPVKGSRIVTEPDVGYRLVFSHQCSCYANHNCTTTTSRSHRGLFGSADRLKILLRETM